MVSLAQVANRRAAKGKATAVFMGEEDDVIVLKGGCQARISSESFDAAVIAAMVCAEWEEFIGDLEDLRCTVVRVLSASSGGSEADQS